MTEASSTRVGGLKDLQLGEQVLDRGDRPYHGDDAAGEVHQRADGIKVVLQVVGCQLQEFQRRPKSLHVRLAGLQNVPDLLRLVVG
jgi:hypothetical protein